MSASYTITIPDVLPSLNDKGRAWGKTYRLKKQWAGEIYVLLGIRAMTELRRLANAQARMRLTITVSNAREYDDDNKRYTEKVICDALKQLGAIHDDRREFLERKLYWVKCKRADKKTVIEIGEAA